MKIRGSIRGSSLRLTFDIFNQELNVDLTPAPLSVSIEQNGLAMHIFWSYAKLDDKEPYKLTKLRRAFNNSLDQTLGYENKIIVDVIDLR